MKKMILLLVAVLLLFGACAEKETIEISYSTQEAVKGTVKETEPPTTEATTPPTVETTPAPTRPPVEVPEVEEVPVEENPKFDLAECEDLVGSWELTVTIPSTYANAPDFTGTASFPVTFTFDEDGRYKVTLEKESFGDAIVSYENALAEVMIDGYYNKFVAEKKISNLTDKQIQQRWEESGLANAQSQTHAFLDQLAMGMTFGQLVRAGYYYAEAGELYLSMGEEYESFRYKVDEEGLILSESSRIRFYSQLCIASPMVLKEKAV